MESTTFSQLRHTWWQLDHIMLEHAHHFHDLKDQPIRPLVLPSGLPNPDPRLYVGYMLLGAIEEMVTLRDDFGLGHSGFVDSVATTVQRIMSMPVAQEIWGVIREQYGSAIREYVDANIPDTQTG